MKCFQALEKLLQEDADLQLGLLRYAELIGKITEKQRYPPRQSAFSRRPEYSPGTRADSV